MVDSVKLVNAANAYQQAVSREVSGGESSDSVDFGGILGQTLSTAIDSVKQGEVTGARTLLKQASIDDLALAVSNAELTLKTVMAIRDRVINAYQDIIKMPI